MQIRATYVLEVLTMKLSRHHSPRYTGCPLQEGFARRRTPAVTYQSLRNVSEGRKDQVLAEMWDERVKAVP